MKGYIAPIAPIMICAVMAVRKHKANDPTTGLTSDLRILNQTDDIPTSVVDALIGARMTPAGLARIAPTVNPTGNAFWSALWTAGVRIDRDQARQLLDVTLAYRVREKDIREHPVYEQLSPGASWPLALLNHTPNTLDLFKYTFESQDELILYLKSHSVSLSPMDTALLRGEGYSLSL